MLSLLRRQIAVFCAATRDFALDPYDPVIIIYPLLFNYYYFAFLSTCLVTKKSPFLLRPREGAAPSSYSGTCIVLSF